MSSLNIIILILLILIYTFVLFCCRPNSVCSRLLVVM